VFSFKLIGPTQRIIFYTHNEQRGIYSTNKYEQKISLSQAQFKFLSSDLSSDKGFSSEENNLHVTIEKCNKMNK
jgi:hypothetical protein